MEWALLGLLVLALPVMAIIAFFKSLSQGGQLRLIEMRLREIEKKLGVEAPSPFVAAPRPPRYLAFDTLTSEADQVADLIAEEHAQGRPLQDFAILVRANHDADAFLRALNTRGGPVPRREPLNLAVEACPSCEVSLVAGPPSFCTGQPLQACV